MSLECFFLSWGGVSWYGGGERKGGKGYGGGGGGIALGLVALGCQIGWFASCWLSLRVGLKERGDGGGFYRVFRSWLAVVDV